MDCRRGGNRLKPHRSVREQLPKLQAAVLERNFDPLDQPRQLALAVAMLRLTERPNPRDVQAVLEALRTTPAGDFTESVVEELGQLAKSHPEIGS